MLAFAAASLLLLAQGAQHPPPARPRAQDLGVRIGTLPPGPLDAITDVAGVRVGHATLVKGDTVRTGVTVILPHGGDPYQRKVPAAIEVQNGYGKLIGITQVAELGELKSPIALTNTLSTARVADAVLGWALAQAGNERVRSLNVVVGETNDGRLNDIRGRHVRAEHVDAALAAARGGAVAEGGVGAGTGTVCFGFKGGIGTASRVAGERTVGVLVQTNFGGRLRVAGRDVHDLLHAALPQGARRDPPRRGQGDRDGSCMIVVATDAPLDARNLGRLARRAFAGMARTGASFSNGSGDYAIAFSTDTEAPRLANAAMTPLFMAVADATEEAILNSLLRAHSVESGSGRAEALPVDALRTALGR